MYFSNWNSDCYITLEDGVSIEGCTSSTGGGGIFLHENNHEGSLTVKGVTFKDCISEAQGGGICLDSYGSKV
jgi:hypothetical protein